MIADRYDLPLDTDLTAGDYLLLSGMYHANTGERLAVIRGPAGPVPDTILLSLVRMAGDELLTAEKSR